MELDEDVLKVLQGIVKVGNKYVRSHSYDLKLLGGAYLYRRNGSGIMNGYVKIEKADAGYIYTGFNGYSSLLDRQALLVELNNLLVDVMYS